MISYELDYWNVLFALSLDGSVFPKALVWATASSVLAGIGHYVHEQSDSVHHVMSGVGQAGTSILSGFTFILGFLIVFRSSQAYARWWEGATLMQQLRGEWFNAASCLIAFSDKSKEKRVDVLKFQHHLVRLISLLYASSLSQICTMKDQCFELIDIDDFERESLRFLHTDECVDHCEVVLQWIQCLIVIADSEGTIKVTPPILSRVYNQLGNGIVNLSNARKITEFPIPFPLAQMIALMLIFHCLSTPLICAVTVSSAFWAAFLCFVVVFSYWCINYIATELEMPFGDDPNDLPLHKMQRDLNASLVTLLQPRGGTCPKFYFNEEKHSKLVMVRLNLNLPLINQIDVPLHEQHSPRDSPRGHGFHDVEYKDHDADSHGTGGDHHYEFDANRRRGGKTDDHYADTHHRERKRDMGHDADVHRHGHTHRATDEDADAHRRERLRNKNNNSDVHRHGGGDELRQGDVGLREFQRTPNPLEDLAAQETNLNQVKLVYPQRGARGGAADLHSAPAPTPLGFRALGGDGRDGGHAVLLEHQARATGAETCHISAASSSSPPSSGAPACPKPQHPPPTSAQAPAGGEAGQYSRLGAGHQNHAAHNDDPPQGSSGASGSGRASLCYGGYMDGTGQACCLPFGSRAVKAGLARR